MNPDLTEAHRLRGWYDSVGSSASYSEYRREGDANTASSGQYAHENDPEPLNDGVINGQ